MPNQFKVRKTPEPGQILFEQIVEATRFLMYPLQDIRVYQPPPIDDMQMYFNLHWDGWAEPKNRVGGNFRISRETFVTLPADEVYTMFLNMRRQCAFDMLVSLRPDRAFIREAAALWRPPIDDFAEVPADLLERVLTARANRSLEREDETLRTPEEAVALVLDGVLQGVLQEVQRVHDRRRQDIADEEAYLQRLEAVEEDQS